MSQETVTDSGSDGGFEPPAWHQHRSKIPVAPGETQCPTCGDDSFDSSHGMKIHHARSHGKKAVTYAECAFDECDETFELDHSDRKYCSPECGHADRRDRVKLKCQHCRRSFEVWPCEADKHNHCPKCVESGAPYKAHRRRLSGREKRTCKQCGSPHYRYPSRESVYCGRPCSWEAKTKRDELPELSDLLRELTDDGNEYKSLKYLHERARAVYLDPDHTPNKDTYVPDTGGRLVHLTYENVRDRVYELGLKEKDANQLMRELGKEPPSGRTEA